MAAALASIEFDRTRMQAALSADILATEAADALVARGIPFRTAHRAVAQAVAEAERRRMALGALAAESGTSLPAPLTAADLANLGAEPAVERRTATGGTARAAVGEQLARARAQLDTWPS
jgi:argininosuccinate lyase